MRHAAWEAIYPREQQKNNSQTCVWAIAQNWSGRKMIVKMIILRHFIALAGFSTLRLVLLLVSVLAEGCTCSVMLGIIWTWATPRHTHVHKHTNAHTGGHFAKWFSSRGHFRLGSFKRYDNKSSSTCTSSHTSPHVPLEWCGCSGVPPAPFLS